MAPWCTCVTTEIRYITRILLAWVQGSDYIVVTPDGDVYIEQIDATSPDLDALHLEALGGGRPFGLPGNHIYAFNPRPAGPELAGLLREAELLARIERQARGVVAGVAGAVPVDGDAVAPQVDPAPLPLPPVAPPTVPGVPPAPAAIPAPRIAPSGGVLGVG